MTKGSFLAAFLVVALALPAFAAGPTRFNLDFSSGPTDIGSCGSFDVLDSRSVTGAQLVWFDASGQPIQAVTHLQAQVTLTNSVTGKSLSGFTNVDQNVDLLAGTEFQHGLAVSVNLPQRGKLYIEAGTIGINFVTGQVTFTPAFLKDFAPLCSALS